MEKRVSMHKLFLPGGLVLLLVGLYGIRNGLMLHGPPADQLHELRLRDVTNITWESEIPGSSQIDNIWLKASNGVVVRYRGRFPFSEQVRKQDTNYSLLLDESNVVWGVKSSDGQEHSRDYFESYHLEKKDTGRILGPFLAVFGGVMLVLYFMMEYKLKTATEIEKAQVDAKLGINAVKFRLVVGLVMYMILFGTVIGPVLMRIVPKFVVALLWVISAGVVMNFLGAWRRPRS